MREGNFLGRRKNIPDTSREPISDGSRPPFVPPRQVDISDKQVVLRRATATGRIRLKPSTVKMIRSGKLAKGDAVSIAQVASILAAKKVPEVIPLCHTLPLESVEPEVVVGDAWVEVTVTVAAHAKTGVEMEALTAAAVGLLNIWDVAKAYEKDEAGQYPATLIESIRVVKKTKGRP